MLLIDAGNTRVKWALAANDAAPGEWLEHGAVTHADLPQLELAWSEACLLYTSPSPRDRQKSRMPSSA